MPNELYKRYPVPAVDFANPHRSSLTIRKSRFESYSSRCQSGKEAREFVSLIREKNPDATHNCWAYAAGDPGSTLDIGSSDDGEPQGTAGKPILNALLHGGVGQICLVVSRWFGGVKLGTGGLSRAYGQCALDNLQSLPREENIIWTNWNIVLPYNQYDRATKILSELEIKIIKSSFGESVDLTLAVPADFIEVFRERIGSLGEGTRNLIRMDN